MLRNIVERTVHGHACEKHGILLDRDTVKEFMAQLERLDEATRKDLLSDMEIKRKKRADSYAAIYQSVNPVDFTIYYTADGDKPTKWNQTIRLEDMKWLIKDKDTVLKDKLRLALTGELKVFCNCPDFLYGGFKYMGTELGYNLGADENRFPIIRNPNLNGTVCKHLYRVLFQLPMHYPMILKKLKGYWDGRL
jgi:hypothetical protein